MIDFSAIIYFIALLGVLLVCKLLVGRLWRENLLERGGPRRSGLILALSGILAPVLLVISAIFLNVFKISLYSLAVLLSVLLLISLPLFLGCYITGRHMYNLYSDREVERLRQLQRPDAKH